MHFDLDTLKLVFARTLLDELVKADDVVTDAELAVVERLAPTAKLTELGLLDASGAPTAAYDPACASAMYRLKRELSLEDRLKVVTGFLELSVVDGQLHRDEGSLMFLGAKMLGIDPQTFDRHLDSLGEHVGAVDLSDPS